MKNNILSFLNAIDPIFLSSKNKNNLFIAVPGNTPQESFAQIIFSKKKLISFKCSNKTLPDNDKILRDKKFNLKIKEVKINSYLLPHRFNKNICEWSKKNNIGLISPEPKIQEKLEDKIYFDFLLKKYKVNSPNTFKSIKEIKSYSKKKALVVQESSSYGFFGTEIYKNKLDFFKKIKNKKINFKRTLIREFVKGPTVGVSIFIDKNGRYFCSALRLQCFLTKNGIPKSFIGIQWLKTSELGKKTKNELEKTISLLAQILKNEKYYGLANFDIILGDKPYVLECNPRLSSATPQIFFWSDLVGKNDAWQALIKCLSQKTISSKTGSKLPKNKTSGSLLDIDIEEKTKIKNILPLGIYQLNKKGMDYLGADTKNLKSDKKLFFLYHDLPGKILIRDATVCTAISNFPLYNPKTGKLNFDGKKIYRYLKNKFIR